MIARTKTADRLVMALAVAAGFPSMGLFSVEGPFRWVRCTRACSP